MAISYATTEIDVIEQTAGDDTLVFDKLHVINRDDFFDGGDGLDTILVGVGHRTYFNDLRTGENHGLRSYEAVQFDTPSGPTFLSVFFSSGQFGPGGVSTALHAIGDPLSRDSLGVVATTDFSVADWTVESWGDDDWFYVSARNSVNVTGSAYRDHVYCSSRDGNNTVDVGDGSDYVRNRGGADVIYLGAGNDGFYIPKHGDHSGVNKLWCGEGNDWAISKGGAIDAQGEQGDDKLHGSVYTDLLDGGAGNDRLRGDDGNDVLTGGTGMDVMNCGRGANRYVFTDIADSGIGALADLIRLQLSHPDRIDVSAIDASSSEEGDQAFTFIGEAEFTAEGQIRAFQSGKDAILQFNVSGTAGSEMDVMVFRFAASTITGADFLL